MRVDLLHAWLAHNRLPMPLKRSLRRYFKAYYSSQNAAKESDLWQDLSPELQREVGTHLIHPDVKSNPLFDGMSIGGVVRLQSILRTVTAAAGHTICSKGEIGEAMYIVVHGWLTLDLRPSEEIEDMKICLSKSRTSDSLGSQAEPGADRGSVELGPGQSFGEEVLLGFVENYNYTVVVKEKVNLEMILESEFLHLFQSMPNEVERMRQNSAEFNAVDHGLPPSGSYAAYLSSVSVRPSKRMSSSASSQSLDPQEET